MSLVKWNPNTGMFPVLSNWMDDFFDGNEDWFKLPLKGAPPLNVRETPKEFILELAAPGYKKEDFKIEVKNGVLMITGKNEMLREEKEEDTMRRREFRLDSFTRTLPLPENVRQDKFVAKYLDGILYLTMPKLAVEEKPAFKISVN